MHLLNFDADTFLRDHWQKKPLLIENAWDRWRNPLEPDELAGLACEDDVVSRLITQAGGGWTLEHGPLPEERFVELEKAVYTLLVQSVDHYAPAVAALVEPFRFVPNWRIDDVMVSYATDGGGVGPHFDQYDVFLIQGLGQRRWQVGAMCDGSTALLPHDDLRLLAEFTATAEWVLGPGDILYVPPGIAHDGVAVGDDCMTYSVGFRAPSRGDLIGGWCAHLLDTVADDDRYRDPDLALQDNPGEISTEALARLHALVTERLLDRAAFARWFGGYSTSPKQADLDWQPDEPFDDDDVRALLASGAPLCRNPASRFSFIRQDNARLLLFVDGECYECTDEAAAFAERICARDWVQLALETRASEPAMALILKLLNLGSVTIAEDD